MATYKEIKGVTVQTRDEDPVIGGIAGATWASGNAIPASGYYWGSAGTQTSNIIAGGYDTAIIDTSFQYDGTNWTSAPSINDGREMVTGWGASSTAALIVAGDSPGFTGATEQFDGSSWTEKNDLNTTRIQGGGAGTSYTSGIFFGGRTPPATAKVETEQWDGTSWTEVGDLNTAIRTSAGFGITTAAISAGGQSTVSGVESWNGSAWTELSGTLNTGRNAMAVSGTQTAGLVFGGSPPVTNKTEAWNGTTFTEVNDMANPLYARGGSPAGSQTAALASGGQPSSPSPTNLTEEFSAAPPTAAILTEGSIFLSGGTTLKGFGKAAGIPSATWSSGGNLNTARNNLMASTRGLQTDTIVFGSGGGSAATENYNGSSWTEVNDLNTGRGNGGGAGTATAALAVGGYTGSTRVANTESWNGSSWTEVNDLNQGNRTGLGSFGLQTAAIAGGGAVPPSTVYNNVESWDGTSWTEIAEINTARYGIAAVGISTDGFFTGGETSLGTPSITGKTEKWNGSSWTESGDLNQVRYSWNGGAGETTSGLVFGGYTGTAITAKTELFNGTSWTELNDLSEAVYDNAQMGSAAAALKAGGNDGSSTAVTEEWTADATLSTITVS